MRMTDLILFLFIPLLSIDSNLKRPNNPSIKQSSDLRLRQFSNLSLKQSSNLSLKQPSNEEAWTKEELTAANTAGDAKYLTGEEKDMVIYMNLARMDGEKFFNTYFQDYMDQHNRQMIKYANYDELKISKTDKYYKSLEADLKKVKGMTTFWPDEAMSWVAEQHAKDMNKNNYATHNSLDGRKVKDRIGKMYPRKACGENLAFGYSSGLANICMLLLDRGVPDLGHRRMILNDDYKFNFVGVSIKPHKGYKYCSVTDFVALPR